MKMQYRPIGQSGLQASVVGLGAEHLDGKPYPLVEEVIHCALECGINIMDLFMPGDEVRANIGRALAGNRDKMLIQGHIGSVSTPREQ
ncbi:MAG: aldo/keto reductase, partial [Oligosphaeraceae bacterium]|nr:aldo/keto reductase [Oligosphaeraceae bacterium]